MSAEASSQTQSNGFGSLFERRSIERSLKGSQSARSLVRLRLSEQWPSADPPEDFKPPETLVVVELRRPRW